MRPFSRTLALGLIAYALSACASTDISVYQAIDPTEKSLTVPPGNRLVLGGIKQALQDKGWKLVVDEGPVRTTGTANEEVSLATGRTYQTRYRLVLNQEQFDLCIVGGAAIFYDLSVIDNANGREVFAQSGRDCEEAIVEKFIKTLTGAG